MRRRKFVRYISRVVNRLNSVLFCIHYFSSITITTGYVIIPNNLHVAMTFLVVDNILFLFQCIPQAKKENRTDFLPPSSTLSHDMFAQIEIKHRRQRVKTPK